MECNSKIFICYRNNNVDIAKKLYEYINARNMEENLNFKKIGFRMEKLNVITYMMH